MAKRIAVIGTGISGASCATRLSQQFECSVKLFEKSRGAGGRMATRRDCTSEGVVVQCDHGAQYFTARSAPFQSQVQEWSKAGVVARWSALPKVYNSEKSTWEDSTSDIGRWCGTPTMNAPVKNMLQNEDVVLNSTVCAIAKTATGEWSLCLEESGWSEDKFDAVVCAVPAPQALVLVEPHSSTLAGVASSTTMKGAWALMLQYPTPLDLPFDSAFINGGPLSWIARDSSKPGRDSGVDTWLVHATAAWSHDNIEKSSEEVATTLLDALCSLKVPPGTKQINLPHTWTAHRWRYATTHPNLNIHSVWDKEAKLGMCGDWLDEGKVEGAWLSGRHLADSINESLCSSGSGAPTVSKL